MKSPRTGSGRELPHDFPDRLCRLGEIMSSPFALPSGASVAELHEGVSKGAVMPFEMTERQVGAVTVIDLTGKLTIDQGAQRLKDKIYSLVEQGRTNVVLNLGDLSYIDSGGLGQLVASYSSLAR